MYARRKMVMTMPPLKKNPLHYTPKFYFNAYACLAGLKYGFSLLQPCTNIVAYNLGYGVYMNLEKKLKVILSFVIQYRKF
jgi:hypothetical protein